MDERMYWLAFSLCNGIGPTRFGKLLSCFGTAEAAWTATEQELIESGIGKALSAQIVAQRKHIIPGEYVNSLQKRDADFLVLSDRTYPELLKQIPNPPFVLYIKGNKKLLQNGNTIAIVGTRKITDYGRQVTEALATELAQTGFTIVSGLALGVDAVAHEAGLAVGGNTIAVLASGVDYCTPRENEFLYEQILQKNGLIVSEVPLGAIPNKGSFPSRNRIIAGLSLGVVVTEGAEDSGSLITATNAGELQRKIFAVPGPITSSVSRGANTLIAKGAKMVTTARDIVEEINSSTTPLKQNRPHKLQGDTKEEQRILDLLVDQNMHFDDLVKQTGFDSALVGTVVSILEMKGLITAHGSGTFGIAS